MAEKLLLVSGMMVVKFHAKISMGSQAMSLYLLTTIFRQSLGHWQISAISSCFLKYRGENIRLETSHPPSPLIQHKQILLLTNQALCLPFFQIANQRPPFSICTFSVMADPHLAVEEELCLVFTPPRSYTSSKTPKTFSVQ